MVELPPELEAAIAQALRAVPGSQWVSAARALSDRYRAERAGTERPLAQGPVAALGYAGLILPAAYAQLRGALTATAARVPNWRPASAWDLGSGPGTALWAAVAQWPSLTTLTAWEREPAFLALGRRLAAAGRHPALPAARWEQATLAAPLTRPAPAADLVILGHLLNEIEPALREPLVDFAWAHCRGILLLVEPGTSAAFPVVRHLREYLLRLGARTIAPCAHDQPCPLMGDWCHFPQRVTRPAFQRRAKDAPAGSEETKFCYAAVGRFPPASPIWGRLIHQPHLDKGGVTLTVSSRAGIVRPRIPKRDRAGYRAARDRRWGDALPEPILPPAEAGPDAGAADMAETADHSV